MNTRETLDARAKAIVARTGHVPTYASLQVSGPRPVLMTEWETERQARDYIALGAVGDSITIEHDVDLGWVVRELVGN